MPPPVPVVMKTLGFDRLSDLGHELADGELRAVVIEMQARFEQQDALSLDRARKVEAEAMIVARHLRAVVIERRFGACHQRLITRDVVAVFVPVRERMPGREQRRHCGSLSRRPCDDHCVVTLEPGKVVGGRRRLREGRWRRSGAAGPRRRVGQRSARDQNIGRKPHRSEPSVRLRRIEVEDDVVHIQRMSHKRFPRELPASIAAPRVSAGGPDRASSQSCSPSMSGARAL